MKVILRTTGGQQALLKNHLFPGDGKEAVAVAICGRRAGAERHILAVHEILPIPYDQCRVRAHDRVEWSTELIVPFLENAMKYNMAVVKIHSHPGGLEEFSWVDDASDRALFDSVYGWTGDEENPHASAIMLPDGKIFGRVVSPDGEFTPIDLVSVAGDDLLAAQQQRHRVTRVHAPPRTGVRRAHDGDARRSGHRGHRRLGHGHADCGDGLPARRAQACPRRPRHRREEEHKSPSEHDGG